MDFSEKNRKLNAAVDLPHINYAGNKIDSLSIRLDTDPENFVFGLGFLELTAGPLAIQQTLIEGQIENQNLYLDFSSIHNDKIFGKCIFRNF